MGGWRDGWAVCEVWVDRWVEGEGKGGVKGPLLMKKKKGGGNYAVFYFTGERIFFFTFMM
jgi:hypothetical protein